MIINAETFTFLTNDAIGVLHFEAGTVEVTLRGETRRVQARRFRGSDIVAFGFVGRYQTGTTLWPASVSLRTDGNGDLYETASFGRNDNHPKFNKLRNIWFAAD